MIFIAGNAIFENSFLGYDILVCLERKLDFQKSYNFYVWLILAFSRIFYIFSKILLTVANDDGGWWQPEVGQQLLKSDWQRPKKSLESG